MSEGALARFTRAGREAFARMQDRKLSAFLHVASAEGRRHHAHECWCGGHVADRSEQ
jgi:hypothetical protein